MAIQESTRFLILKTTVSHEDTTDPDEAAKHVTVFCDTENVAIEHGASEVVQVLDEWEYKKIKKMIAQL